MDVNELITSNAPKGRFPDLGSKGGTLGASFPDVAARRAQDRGANPPSPSFPEVARASSPSFPELPKAAQASGPVFPDLPKTQAAQVAFPDMPKTPQADRPSLPNLTSPANESGPSFPDTPKAPPSREFRFPEMGASGNADRFEFPETGPRHTAGGNELTGTLQTIGRTMEMVVQSLQAIHRMGSTGGTPGLQQLGRPAMVWDESVEGYPAASPSINTSTKAGLRGAGGYGFGSGGHDGVNFLEPSKRRPGV